VVDILIQEVEEKSHCWWTHPRRIRKIPK